MVIAKKVKELRKKAGLTQVELSKRVGVGLRFLRELERGKPTVRLDRVVLLLEFLDHHLEVIKNARE